MKEIKKESPRETKKKIVKQDIKRFQVKQKYTAQTK